MEAGRPAKEGSHRGEVEHSALRNQQVSQGAAIAGCFPAQMALFLLSTEVRAYTHSSLAREYKICQQNQIMICFGKNALVTG